MDTSISTEGKRLDGKRKLSAYVPISKMTKEDADKKRYVDKLRQRRYRQRKKALKRNSTVLLPITNVLDDKEKKHTPISCNITGMGNENERKDDYSTDSLSVDLLGKGNGKEKKEESIDDSSVIDLVTPTKHIQTVVKCQPCIDCMDTQSYYPYSIITAKDSEEEKRRMYLTCKTLNSQPQLGDKFDAEFRKIRHEITEGNQQDRRTIKIIHERLANPMTTLADEDLKKVLTLGSFVTDAVVYYYSALLLNRDLAMVKQLPARKRSWIYSPHFITRLGREKETEKGYKYDREIKRWGTKVPGM
jgi:hypothetical protein